MNKSELIDAIAADAGITKATAKLALERRVHGPRQDGSTFLAQFATKDGINTQLITNIIGPMELWAFNTTAEDVRIRNRF